jgi:hypothetical protein
VLLWRGSCPFWVFSSKSRSVSLQSPLRHWCSKCLGNDCSSGLVGKVPPLLLFQALGSLSSPLLAQTDTAIEFILAKSSLIEGKYVF